MDGAESACSASLAGRDRHVETSHVALGFGEALGPSSRWKEQERSALAEPLLKDPSIEVAQCD
jgi:hypothetical protein